MARPNLLTATDRYDFADLIATNHASVRTGDQTIFKLHQGTKQLRYTRVAWYEYPKPERQEREVKGTWIGCKGKTARKRRLRQAALLASVQSDKSAQGYSASTTNRSTKKRAAK